MTVDIRMDIDAAALDDTNDPELTAHKKYIVMNQHVLLDGTIPPDPAYVWIGRGNQERHGMGFKARMFNRKAASPKSRPDEVLAALDLRPGQRIADIGSGGGYFTLRLAEAVGPQGRVFAVDTDSELLKQVDMAARENGIGNVSTVLSEGERPKLPEQGLDLAFIRNVTHHIADRKAYFSALREFLVPHGRVAIIEYLPATGLSFRSVFGHHVPKEILIGEMKAAGYQLVGDHDFLPEQSFTIYEPVGPEKPL